MTSFYKPAAKFPTTPTRSSNISEQKDLHTTLRYDLHSTPLHGSFGPRSSGRVWEDVSLVTNKDLHTTFFTVPSYNSSLNRVFRVHLDHAPSVEFERFYACIYKGLHTIYLRRSFGPNSFNRALRTLRLHKDIHKILLLHHPLENTPATGSMRRCVCRQFKRPLLTAHLNHTLDKVTLVYRDIYTTILRYYFRSHSRGEV